MHRPAFSLSNPLRPPFASGTSLKPPLASGTNIEEHPTLCDKLVLKPVTSTHPEVLRVVTPARVLQNFGAIFEGQKSSKFHAGLRGSDQTSNLPMKEDTPQVHSTMSMHRAADEIDFNKADAIWRGSSVASEADMFLSHVWGVPRWKKALGVYYYLNVNIALAAAVGTWVLLILGLVLRNGWTSMGGKDYLVPVLVYIPTLVFFVALFSAHIPRTSLRLWLDKLCIHQADPELKALGMEAMLEVTSCSRRLCILWDETYFERLWCNAEVATFSATQDGAVNIDFVPLWLPPWIITALLMDILCSSLVAQLSWVAFPFAEFFQSWLGNDTWVTCLMVTCVLVVQYGVGYLPLLIPNYFAMTAKIQQHNMMFEQLRMFQHSRAKCTVESDRQFVQKHICALFNEDGDSDEQSLERFDQFVNVDLLKMVEAKVSTASMLPMREAFLVVLPLIFASGPFILSCDKHDCMESAAVGMPSPPPWFDQLTAYMVWNASTYMIAALLCYPVTYPLILWSVERAMRVHCLYVRVPLVLLSIVLGYCCMGALVGIACGFSFYAVQYGGIYLLAAAVYAALFATFGVWLTRAQAPAKDQRDEKSRQALHSYKGIANTV